MTTFRQSDARINGRLWKFRRYQCTTSPPTVAPDHEWIPTGKKVHNLIHLLNECQFGGRGELTRIFISECPARLMAGWMCVPTNRWLSLAHVRICVKNHSGLSRRFVWRVPVKWNENLQTKQIVWKECAFPIGLVTGRPTSGEMVSITVQLVCSMVGRLLSMWLQRIIHFFLPVTLAEIILLKCWKTKCSFPLRFSSGLPKIDIRQLSSIYLLHPSMDWLVHWLHPNTAILWNSKPIRNHCRKVKIETFVFRRFRGAPIRYSLGKFLFEHVIPINGHTIGIRF